MANLADSQTTASTTSSGGHIYKKDEIIEKGMLLCIRGATKTRGNYGWQWQIDVMHAEGEQRLWFGPAADPTQASAQATIWDKVFSGISEWPNHSYALIKEKGKYQKFVYHPELACPCTLHADEANAEAEQIIQQSLADAEPASAGQRRKLSLMCAALDVEYIDDEITVGEWRTFMHQLAMKQAGLTA